jgi:hypothetical protein
MPRIHLVAAAVALLLSGTAAFAQFDIASCGALKTTTSGSLLQDDTANGVTETSRDVTPCPVLVWAGIDVGSPPYNPPTLQNDQMAVFTAQATGNLYRDPGDWNSYQVFFVGHHAVHVPLPVVPPIMVNWEDTHDHVDVPARFPTPPPNGDPLDNTAGQCQDGSPGPCGPDSPILIDMAGDGYRLTSATKEVLFDIDADGTPEMVAWTLPDSDDAWLARDVNGNGKIDNGSELFGNHTVGPYTGTVTANGFLALRFNIDLPLDGPSGSGLADGSVNSADPRWIQLLLWTDGNHNGVSEPNELQAVSTSSLRSIETKATVSKRVDQYGNLFKLRAKAYFAETAKTKTGRTKKTFTQDEDLPDDIPGLHPRFVYDVWLTNR